MSNTEDQNQLNEEQLAVEMSLQDWVQLIEENKEELLAQVLKIEEGMDLDLDTEMSTNPVVEHLMKIAVEELEEWKATRKEHPDSDLHVAFNLHGKKVNMNLESDLPDLMIKYFVLMAVMMAATYPMHDDM